MVQVDSKEGGPRIYGTITNIGNQEVTLDLFYLLNTEIFLAEKIPKEL